MGTTYAADQVKLEKSYTTRCPWWNNWECTRWLLNYMGVVLLLLIPLHMNLEKIVLNEGAIGSKKEDW